LPITHGLFGNAIALDEGDGLKPVSVGPPDFRERLRAATGRTLLAPTLAEHVADSGGANIYSNSSAGAAHLQDPDGHGWLYHRSGSHAPGLVPLSSDPMQSITYDASGDADTVSQLCDALLSPNETPVFITWICEPDHSQHALELGCEAHHAIIRGSDTCAGRVKKAVDTLRQRGDDVLFVLGSDHGHETVDTVVPIESLLVKAGLKTATDSSDVVLASSGMGALIYLAPDAQAQSEQIAQWLSEQKWCGAIYAGDALEDIGLAPRGGLAIAFSMGKKNAVNRYGIPGFGHVAGDRFMPSHTAGHGQHGGLGPYETQPFLIVEGGDFSVGTSDEATCTIDIAPTLLRHLGLATHGMDGAALPLSD
jgi:arylsulfatase A-like enzyme